MCKVSAITTFHLSVGDEDNVAVVIELDGLKPNEL